MITALLALQLASSAVDLEVARDELRVRADVQGALGAAFSGFAGGAGPGLSLEIGMVFADRFSAGVRGTVGSIVTTTTAMVGIALEYAIDDRFNVGVTPSIGGVVTAGFPASIALFAPARLTFAADGPARSGNDVQRRALTLFAEVGPGFALIMSTFSRTGAPVPSPLSLTFGVGVGYSLW